MTYFLLYYPYSKQANYSQYKEMSIHHIVIALCCLINIIESIIINYTHKTGMKK